MIEGRKYAEIIIERMKEKSCTSSQAKLAKEVFGVQPARITDAKNTGRIPDRWFEVMEDKYGISKEELCKDLPQNRPTVGITTKSKDGTTSTVTFSMPYGNASDEEEKIHCLQEFNSLFQIIIKWQAEENGLDSLTSMNFIREFHERFPELGDWLKKRKDKSDKTPPTEILSDGTHGK